MPDSELHPIPVNQSGVQDDTDLQEPVMSFKAPDYCTRLLSGASVIPQHDCVLITSHDYGFRISREFYDRLRDVSEAVRSAWLRPRGIDPQAVNVETLLCVREWSRLMWHKWHQPNQALLKVLFLTTDTGGCGFYRGVQPAKMLNAYTQTIKAECHYWEGSGFLSEYDVIVSSRALREREVNELMVWQAHGVAVVLDIDDYLAAMPDSNPARGLWDEEHQRGQALLTSQADAVFVSTRELANALRPAVPTFVCPNCINPTLWPMEVRAAQTQKKTRIAWWGSDTHRDDLTLLVQVVKDILKRHEDVEFHFMGSMPEQLAMTVYEQGRGRRLVPHSILEDRVRLHAGTAVLKFPEALARLNADIALAPLVDDEFNRCKSELKVLEAAALGIPVLCSPVAPYLRAGIGETAASINEWNSKLSSWVRQPLLRREVAAQGLKVLQARYVTSVVAPVYEKALLQVASGRVTRKECADAIAARLKELG